MQSAWTPFVDRSSNSTVVLLAAIIIYARGINAMTDSVATGTRMATNKHVTCRN